MADNGSQAVLMAEMAGGMYGPNQYSQYPNGIPFPSYFGAPTDAMGRPIQPPPPGMTLNSSPAMPPQQQQAAPVHGVGGLQPGQWDDASGLPAGQPSSFAHATDPSGMPYGQTSLGRGVVGQNWQPQQQAQAAPQAAPQAAGPANNWQSTLAMLSNPGKVQTPGATVPQSTIGSQPSVLQQFLANQKGGTGA